MKYHVIAAMFFCSVVNGFIVPDACRRSCDGIGTIYTHDCKDIEEYCSLCRSHFCPQPIWFGPMIGFGFNPFAVKTCGDFPEGVVATCNNGKHVSSQCQLRCARGYMFSPDLYKGYGNKAWSYTHDQLTSFTTKCSHTTAGSVDWSPNEFSCIKKEKVMEIFYPVETHLMLTKPDAPYPDDYVLAIFNNDLKDETQNDVEASGSGRRSGMNWYMYCGPACMWENNDYKMGCRQVGIYFCIACRLHNICGMSRSFVG